MAENVEVPATPLEEQPKPKKVTFDDEQQVVVQGLIDKAQGQVYQKLTPEIQTLKGQIDELKAELKAKAVEVKPEVKPDAAPKRKEAEEQLATLNAKLEEMSKIAEDLKREKLAAEQREAEQQKQNKDARLKEEFIRASESIDFFDRMEIFDVLKSQFGFDDRSNVVVINPATGEPRKNINLEPMSLSEYLQQYAKEKPWKVRAKNTDGGTGSGESRRISTETPSDLPDFSKMKPEEFHAYSEQVIAKQHLR